MSGTAAAQGAFGIGGRISFVRTDVELVDEESRRFWGGQIRARMSPRTGVRAVARSSGRKPTKRRPSGYGRLPIQASLLLFPARGAFSPFVLGGAGWYSQKFETLVGDETVLSETVREFGWHAGFGAELRMGPMSVCTATIAIPSWTSAATMTTMTTMTMTARPSSAASSRATAVRCGRRA